MSTIHIIKPNLTTDYDVNLTGSGIFNYRLVTEIRNSNLSNEELLLEFLNNEENSICLEFFFEDIFLTSAYIDIEQVKKILNSSTDINIYINNVLFARRDVEYFFKKMELEK